jgi:hypothetical protein
MANTENFAGRLAGYPQNSTSFAAGIAWAYSNNSGKTDWHLPSKDELNELCKYAKNTGQASGSGTVCTGGSDATLRGFSWDYYWSSSEYNASAARMQGFLYGGQDWSGKTNPLKVRLVRAFG